ncbi:MAG: hypothetical protein AVDCRST_MAG40-1124 [uncultured Gemmatimonadaceae bacterium]|uniref:Uncharacterized protein n=1 Tax=uncultured Gemmatimonadaceae bacterium TaxID=246130 RepID=A0A6J4KT52_9BACT|nr:MAG: hypothetical protein AVDCRST_MAG40-1124 [uncultured Gemmatimonadaceae bacterium]
MVVAPDLRMGYQRKSEEPGLPQAEIERIAEEIAHAHAVSPCWRDRWG